MKATIAYVYKHNSRSLSLGNEKSLQQKPLTIPSVAGGWATHLKYMVVKLDHFPEIGMIIKNLLYIYIYIHRHPVCHFPFFLLPLPLSCHCCWMAWSSLDLWHVEVPLVRGTCESWPFERDFAHPKLSRKKMPRERSEPPPKQEPVRIDSAQLEKVRFLFSNIRILEFWEMAEECMFQGYWKIWKLKVARLHVSLPVAQEHLIYTEIPHVSGFWCYIKSRWRKHTRIRISIALVIVFGSYFRLEARLSNLKRWCLPTLAWLFGPCRGPRSQVCDGNLHSSHYQDAANPTMLHVPKSLHIPWTTEDMSISRLINT